MNKTLLYTGLAAIALMGAGCKDEDKTSTPGGTPSTVQEAQPKHEYVVMDVNAPLCNNKPQVTMNIIYWNTNNPANNVSYEYNIDCGKYSFNFRMPRDSNNSLVKKGCNLEKYGGGQSWADKECDGQNLSWRQNSGISEENIKQYNDALVGIGARDVAEKWLEMQPKWQMLGEGLMNSAEMPEIEVNAPFCNNHPNVKMEKKGFEIDCGDYVFRHAYSAPYINNMLERRGNPNQHWTDNRGDGKLESYRAASDPAVDTVVQQFQDVLTGIGQPEVQAQFEKWLKANGQ